MKTETVLLLAGAGVLALILMNKSSAPPPLTVIRTMPQGNSNAILTASEITAGTSLVNNLVDDLFPDQDS